MTIVPLPVKSYTTITHIHYITSDYNRVFAIVLTMNCLVSFSIRHRRRIRVDDFFGGSIPTPGVGQILASLRVSKTLQS